MKRREREFKESVPQKKNRRFNHQVYVETPPAEDIRFGKFSAEARNNLIQKEEVENDIRNQKKERIRDEEEEEVEEEKLHDVTDMQKVSKKPVWTRLLLSNIGFSETNRGNKCLVYRDCCFILKKKSRHLKKCKKFFNEYNCENYAKCKCSIKIREIFEDVPTPNYEYHLSSGSHSCHRERKSNEDRMVSNKLKKKRERVAVRIKSDSNIVKSFTRDLSNHYMLFEGVGLPFKKIYFEGTVDAELVIFPDLLNLSLFNTRFCKLNINHFVTRRKKKWQEEYKAFHKKEAPPHFPSNGRDFVYVDGMYWSTTDSLLVLSIMKYVDRGLIELESTEGDIRSPEEMLLCAQVAVEDFMGECSSAHLSSPVSYLKYRDKEEKDFLYVDVVPSGFDTVDNYRENFLKRMEERKRVPNENYLVGNLNFGHIKYFRKVPPTDVQNFIHQSRELFDGVLPEFFNALGLKFPVVEYIKAYVYGDPKGGNSVIPGRLERLGITKSNFIAVEDYIDQNLTNHNLAFHDVRVTNGMFKEAYVQFNDPNKEHYKHPNGKALLQCAGSNLWMVETFNIRTYQCVDEHKTKYLRKTGDIEKDAHITSYFSMLDPDFCLGILGDHYFPGEYLREWSEFIDAYPLFHGIGATSGSLSPFYADDERRNQRFSDVHTVFVSNGCEDFSIDLMDNTKGEEKYEVFSEFAKKLHSRKEKTWKGEKRIDHRYNLSDYSCFRKLEKLHLDEDFVMKEFWKKQRKMRMRLLEVFTVMMNEKKRIGEEDEKLARLYDKLVDSLNNEKKELDSFQELQEALDRIVEVDTSKYKEPFEIFKFCEDCGLEFDRDDRNSIAFYFSNLCSKIQEEEKSDMLKNAWNYSSPSFSAANHRLPFLDIFYDWLRKLEFRCFIDYIEMICPVPMHWGEVVVTKLIRQIINSGPKIRAFCDFFNVNMGQLIRIW